jgi:hypothetical protein
MTVASLSLVTPWASSTEAASGALRERIARLVGRLSDVVITHIEVNEKHGVGVLTKTIFGDAPRIVSIRSQDHFGGEQQFGALSLRLSHTGARAHVYTGVLAALQGVGVRRVVCIPYYPDDVRTAIALKDIHAAPLCTYLMDDQNVTVDGIPDDLMRELLAKSELRLAISSELRAAYEQKYGLRFWVVPPVVAGEHLQTVPRMPPAAALQAQRGVIVGNVWSQRWLRLLRATVKGTGVTLDWYCNSGLRWNESIIDALAADGIHARGAVSDQALIATLRESPFVVVPSGTLDELDDRRFIAQLSLPSRITYVIATSNTPVIVVGDERTAAARFAVGSGTGAVSRYDGPCFLRTIKAVTAPDTQARMRRRAAQIAPALAADGVREWIWRSLEAGAAVDDRFEKLLTRDSQAREDLCP